MKLRNKKTGKIIDSKELLTDEFLTTLFSKDFDYFISKLDKIQKKWEDYEEPKHKYYFLRDGGNVDYYWYQKLSEITERREQIGNYFETREEAEQAVEKLKAWKRLKDKGFRFKGWQTNDNLIHFEIKNIEITPYFIPMEIAKDMGVLFGGEE